MPIYEYVCDTCGETTELIRGIAETSLVTHPGCGGTLSKLVSSPSVRVRENDGLTGSTHSSILRFHENEKIAADRKKKPAATLIPKTP